MPKLLDQNTAQLAATFVSISGAVKNFVEDDEFMTALTSSIRKNSKNSLYTVMMLFSELTHFILDKHLSDTIIILAAIEGEDAKTMLKKNGTEVLKDAIAAWQDQLKDFFLQLGITV